MSLNTCATCRHALPIRAPAWPDAATSCHCAHGCPSLPALPITGWIIGMNGACKWVPSKWEQA